MPRRADRVDREWVTNEDIDMGGRGLERMSLEVLMDIRAELKRLNTLLHCSNFVGIPTTLRAISRKMPARRKVKR